MSEEPVSHFPRDVLAVLGSDNGESAATEFLTNFALGQTIAKPPRPQLEAEGIFVNLEVKAFRFNLWFVGDIFHCLTWF